MSSSRRRRLTAFSLIETMISASILALAASGVLSMMTFTIAEVGKTRVRTLAASDATETLDRIFGILAIATKHSLNDTALCAALQASGGPMDPTGASVSGTCPALTVSGISVANTGLKRTVALSNLEIAPGIAGLLVTVSSNSPSLAAPIVVQSHFRR